MHKVMQTKQLLKYLPFFMMISPSAESDWRTSSSDGDKLQKLIEALPGTAHWMFEMGERYKNLYWAAKQEKWEFAEYQVEEIDKLLHLVMITRPERAKTSQEFLDSAIPVITQAVESRQWSTFEIGFGQLTTACMHCHIQNDHAFIQLPVKPGAASSPVLNMGQGNE
jgi:hypothetical protein